VDAKECLHCGNLVPVGADTCSCGFASPDEDCTQRGPSAARTVADRARAALTKKWRPPKQGEVEAEAKDPPAPPSPPEPARQPEPPKPAPVQKARPEMKAAASETNESRLMGCPTCGARISKRALECPKCGQSPWADCKVCGARISTQSESCSECGDPDPFNPW
jgi:ribosomal protein L40E